LVFKKYDPCPCGSGKPYGECCGNPLNKVVDLNRWRWQKHSQFLRLALSQFVEEDFLEEIRNKAFSTYFNETNEDFDDIDEARWTDFLEWFIFDFMVEEKKTVLELFIEEHQEELETEEKELLLDWSKARISLYEIQAIYDYSLEVKDLLRRLSFNVEGIEVEPEEEIKKGDLLIARLLPVHDHWELSSGAVVSAPELTDILLEVIRDDYRRFYDLESLPSFLEWEEYLTLNGFKLYRLAEEVNQKIRGFEFDDFALNKEEIEKKLASYLDHILHCFWEIHLREEYYRQWLEAPLERLDNKSPREAAGTEKGRRILQRIVAELEEEEKEKEKEGEVPYPIERLKRKLGLLPGMCCKAKEYNWADNKYAEVAFLLQDVMLAKNFLPGQVAGALKIWFDFSNLEKPQVRKPESWAAGVTYALARLDFAEDTTQQEVASWYNVSAATVSHNFRKIDHRLSLIDFDKRYATEESPLVGLEYLMNCLPRP